MHIRQGASALQGCEAQRDGRLYLEQYKCLTELWNSICCALQGLLVVINHHISYDACVIVRRWQPHSCSRLYYNIPFSLNDRLV